MNRNLGTNSLNAFNRSNSSICYDLLNNNTDSFTTSLDRTSLKRNFSTTVEVNPKSLADTQSSTRVPPSNCRQFSSNPPAKKRMSLAEKVARLNKQESELLDTVSNLGLLSPDNSKSKVKITPKKSAYVPPSKPTTKYHFKRKDIV
ncbi:hypothetical protein BB560_001428 [Smittium megazygosporum]|uniref:Uncharacterized protein n=1 Tax=Smittium megazygosporum TaxID=133381 RepID=A0A2T9ZHP5_9FUNG|nr:hypothetical protein BB560_001425 [Smittium megazygosporum]PVV04082.1 hypothetical protein BB560_001428 [Smittium megazygosporum]